MPAASLLPLAVYFLLGIALRTSGIAGREHAPFLFRLVFYVTLPPLAFLAIADAALTRESALLPVIGFCVNLVLLGSAWQLTRRTGMERDEAGIVMLGAAIANMVFMFPFVLAALGPAALADAVLIDLGNAVFMATIANTLAMRLGHRESRALRKSLYGMLRTPIFLALVGAIILNLAGARIPAPARSVLETLGAVTIPVMLIALGMSLHTAQLRGAVPRLTVVLRMALGLAVGFVVVVLLGLEGSRALVVIASAAAPVGFNAVTLTAVARFDTERAAAAVSLSVLVGLPSTVAILWLGQLLLSP